MYSSSSSCLQSTEICREISRSWSVLSLIFVLSSHCLLSLGLGFLPWYKKIHHWMLCFSWTISVSWKSKKQTTIPRSLAEADQYRSMTIASYEITWLKYLLADVIVLHSRPIVVHCDSKAALHIAANLIFHVRIKHIALDCHLIHDKIQEGTISTAYTPSSSQLVDLLTKALPSPLQMGVLDIYSPSCYRASGGGGSKFEQHLPPKQYKSDGKATNHHS